MLLPGELELPLYAGLSAVQMRTTDQTSCLKVVAGFDVITLSLAKLNHISFYRSHTAHFYSPWTPDTPDDMNIGQMLDCQMKYPFKAEV